MYEREVATGASWFDQVRPGWERDVDLGKLDVGSINGCLCSQVFENAHALASWLTGRYLPERATGFYYVIQMMGNDRTWAVRHGFATYGGRYNLLTEAWTTLIKNRFDTGALSDAGD